MPESQERNAAAPSPLDAIGLITTLITISAAVLIYMGWDYLDGYLRAFNMRPTDLGFGADEYALYGLNLVSPVFLPWMVAVPLVLATVTYRARLARSLPQRLRRVGQRLRSQRFAQVVMDARVAGVVLTLAGLVLAIAALHGRQISTYYLLAPAILGPLLLTWPSRTQSTSKIAFGVSVIISIFCLLWVASLYAQERGRDVAREVVRSLPTRTQVAIFAKDSLAIDTPGVTSQPIKTGRYRHLYTGLRLLLVRDDRYYLLPVVTEEQWKGGESRTFVLVQNDDVRLEFLPGARF